jgi:NAD(P)-dependent dehydrogenase (short-subunit alcohol dehydrogenase family)
MVSGKVVVVTGGAGLIGSSFVEAILQSNGCAVIADKDEEKGKRLADLMSEKYPEQSVSYYCLDICSVKSLKLLIDSLDEKYGRIDAVINNAYPKNKQFGKDFFDVEFDSFCDNVNQNLGGYFLVSQQFAKYFKEQGAGNIINMSSIYGMMNPKYDLYKGTNMSMPIEYAAIKSALNQLTKYMAHYFKDLGIRVNTISPGGIFDHQPESFLEGYKEHCSKKGMLNPQDLSGTLLFLLSDKSEYINGQNIIVDDGFSL